MLHADLSSPGTYTDLLRHAVWETALGWLRELPPTAALGTHEILGRRMFASIQAYETQPREACRFESHREHVDLQYTIEGVEAIDWSPRSYLTPDGQFENDVQFWLPPNPLFTTLIQSSGRFAIFFPEDAHRPKVVFLRSTPVRKLVIKIHLDLIR
jgi:YhcH/YjgK/YiaL family protein